MLKRRLALIAGTLLFGSVVVISILYLVPLNLMSVQQKPGHAQKVYDYYIIIDEQDNESLMYVPLVVSLGDEVITETNKRYKIVKIEENRAYARFVENINLEEYKPQTQ